MSPTHPSSHTQMHSHSLILRTCHDFHGHKGGRKWSRIRICRLSVSQVHRPCDTTRWRQWTTTSQTHTHTQKSPLHPFQQLGYESKNNTHNIYNIYIHIPAKISTLYNMWIQRHMKDISWNKTVSGVLKWPNKNTVYCVANELLKMWWQNKTVWVKNTRLLKNES